MIQPAARPAHAARTTLATLVIVAGLILMIAVPAWQLVVPGPFDWHVAQPGSWQGGIEALLLCACIAAGFAINRRWVLWTLVAIPAAVYARRHSFDIPLLIDVLYLEVTIGLGLMVQARLGMRMQRSTLDYLHAFAIGFIVWSLLAWCVSALNRGSIHDLRWLTCLLALPVVYAANRPFSVFMFRRMRETSASTRIWCGMLAGWCLVLFARTKVALGYDALWYGLQPQHVLVPRHSIFESLGLVSPVHYYPKIYEMWLLPVSGLGDSSVICGMGILVMVLLLIACRAMMREVNLDEAIQMPALALIATLPALANVAGQPKPDVFATLFVLLSALAAARYIRRPSIDAASWAAACAAIACSAKLTAVPYIGTLVVATLVASWLAKRAEDTAPDPAPRTGWLILLLTLPVAGFVHTRTWLLSGLPTIGPDPLFKLWHVLGFRLIEPAGTLDWSRSQDWADVPQLLIDGIFRPQVLPHLVIGWTGNVWLWLALGALVGWLLFRGRAGKWPPFPAILPMATLALCALILAFSIRYLVRGGDGNYYLFGLIPVIIMAALAASRELNGSRFLTRLLLAGISAFVLFQASYSFLSGSWAPGTRPLDARFSLSWKAMGKDNKRILDYYGVSRIAAHLRELPGHPRATGLVEEPLLFRLPARYEDLALVSYSRPEYLSSPAALLSFLRDQGISCLILPRPQFIDRRNPYSGTVERAARLLQDMPGISRVVEERYVMVDASNASGDDWRRAIQHARRESGAGESQSTNLLHPQ